MKIDFISNVVKNTLLIAIVFVIASLFYHNPFYTVGIGISAFWSAINLFLIMHLLQAILINESKDSIKIFVIACVKFPLLYLTGYLMLNSGYFPAESLILGFSLIFVVIFVKGLFQMLTQKVENV